MKRVLGILCLALMLLYTLTSCGLTVPRPEIKSGEFDFTVTYEYGGETKTVSGVYVCEYNGTVWRLDGGSQRDWTGYIKGGDEDDVFEIAATADGATIELRLNLYPDYFMGDFDEYADAPTPYIAVTLVNEEGTRILHEPDDVEEYCGARIIDYEYGKPIENTFGLLK